MRLEVSENQEEEEEMKGGREGIERRRIELLVLVQLELVVGRPLDALVLDVSLRRLRLLADVGEGPHAGLRGEAEEEGADGLAGQTGNGLVRVELTMEPARERRRKRIEEKMNGGE